MTLQVTLTLSPELERKIRTGIKRQDHDLVRRLLADALTPTVEALMGETTSPLQNNEWEVTANLLADELQKLLPQNRPVLSDYAVNRESIYAELA
jgi:hypothetical protein